MASYARMWDRFTAAGVAVAAIVVDSVAQNEAMVEKLLLPFPILSDPDSLVITEWGLLNERENIAKPAIFGIRPDWSIFYGYVGEDYADRPTDDELFAGLAGRSQGG